jgi:penicillin-binding protein 1A
MAWGKHDSERQEPVFGTSGSPFDLKLDPRDRAGGPSEPAKQRKSAGRSSPSSPKKPRSKRSKKSKGGKLRRLVYWAVVLAIWGAVAIGGVIALHMMRLPPIQSLVVPKRPPTISILGLDGKTFATRGDMGGAAIPLKALPPYLPQAFVAIEDRRYYHHFGLDPIGLVRAVAVNLAARGVREGGSTLTQQLAKNLFLTQERTFSRKIDEVIIALALESEYSKNEILELYLNRVYFGSGAYGVEAAAQRYFGKSARVVTLGEAAMLAGLVKAPSRLAPTRNPQLARERAQLVLKAMVDAGFVSEAMARTARERPVLIAKDNGPASTSYVADWVMDALNDYIGRFENDVVVQTTIDPVLQSVAEKSLIEELTKNGDRYGVTQGALVAMDTDGSVRALVGGKSYAESQFNRAISGRRQPGSAFKPFVYLSALERGLTPDTVRDDAPISVRGWKPENYSRDYRGPVTLTEALANSLNTVSVRLTLEVGPQTVATTARRLGIASKLEPNASLALGTSEVTPLELVGAYAPFANGGISVIPHVIDRVRGQDGKILYARAASGANRVVSPENVGMMNRMLSETLLTGTARRASILGWTAAGKTGTSQDYRDAWFVGYTGHMIAGVWLGNDDSTPTKKASGSGMPVDIWNRFMKAAHQNIPVVELPGGPTTNGWDQPMPSGAVNNQTPSGTNSRDQSQSGFALDRWLFDKLFGRR